MLKTALLLVLAVAYSAADSDLTQSAYLDVEEKFYIEWQYSDTNITILAKVKTTGWFGIGFSPNGGMAGADIITASVVNGKAMLQDRYAERNGYPSIDESQDVQLLDGSEVNGVTSIKFTRKHNTCDDKDMLVGTDTMRVIYAISADGSDNLSYHTPFNRGTRSVFLRRKFSTHPSMPDDVHTVDIKVDDLSVPAYHTTYNCEVIRTPTFPTKRHVIKVEPLIQKENLGVVHHIAIYGCYDSLSREHHFNNNKTGFDCLEHANMPPDIASCRAATIFAWGVGGGATIYPEEAGFPFGDEDTPDYLVMETHYDNPHLLAGIRDNSGFRLFLTSQLRKHDVGVLVVGAVHGIAIPPKVKDFNSVGFCTNHCTSKNLKQELNVFGSFLHAHLSSTQIILRQFRDGRDLRTIDEDRHYDFNYQQYKNFEKPLDIKAGDEMMVQCHYNTESRSNMTFGGLPSRSEMCVAFLFYYPATHLHNCYSFPGWVGFPRGGAEKFFEDHLDVQGLGNSSAGFLSALNQITERDLWTEERVKKLQDVYYDVPQYDLCMRRDHFTNPPSQSFLSYTPPKDSKHDLPNKDQQQCETTPTRPSDSVIG